MRKTKLIAALVAIAWVLALTAAGASAQNSDNSRPVQVPQGTKTKVQGVVSSRNGDMFKVRAPDGAETTVVLTSSTDVTSHGMRKKEYPVTYIMKGLRVQAQGKGDSDGNLVADWVRFDEQDLRSAQALEQTTNLRVRTRRGWKKLRQPRAPQPRKPGGCKDKSLRTPR